LVPLDRCGPSASRDKARAGRAISSNFGDASYDGPCPPSGSGLHEYQLTIWALPIPTITFAVDMKATDLSARLAKIALDHATLTGFVKR
jgi:hypothetical protein